jgi:hypothetical protein
MQGWSRLYAFSTGDLMACGQLLDVCISKVGRAFVSLPWEEIRFMIGDIMYGGHITDTWDRRTNLAYLRTVFQPDILEGTADLAPGAGYSEDIGFQDTPRTGLGIHLYCWLLYALLFARLGWVLLLDAVIGMKVKYVPGFQAPDPSKIGSLPRARLLPVS